ncbi:MAG: ABC transporter permease [Nitrospiraceae bacterium]|nr:ABC transporter permease [Nitrospiraceae bacterium]
MIEANAVYVIIAREFKKFIREKTRLVSTIARPLVWLFLVGGGMSRLVPAGGGVSYMQFIFPGILGMTILFSSIFSSISIIWDKEFGFMKEILVAPISRFSIVVGKAMSGMVLSTLQAGIILAFFPVLGLKIGLAAVIGILLVSAVLAFAISSLGIVLASFYDSYESFSVIMNFIVMPMFFLSGAMYPVKLMPPVLRFFTRVNPLTYGIDAIKHLSLPAAAGTMGADFPLLLDLSVIVAASIVLVTIGGKSFERKG